MKPFAPACERNREPILAVLRDVFVRPGAVLEIGSGTGQHAVHFAENLPHLRWQPSDIGENLGGIHAWIDEAGLANLLPPIELDVRLRPWPVRSADHVFSANTAHIMSWPEVEIVFEEVGSLLPPGGRFALYGPFHYGGRPTSPSNAQFDRMLRERDPQSGIRNFEDVDERARHSGLTLIRDAAMPANNHTLVWERRPKEDEEDRSQEPE